MDAVLSSEIMRISHAEMQRCVILDVLEDTEGSLDYNGFIIYFL
jgi:hypothetical protein